MHLSGQREELQEWDGRELTMARALLTGPQVGPRPHRAFGMLSGDLMRRYNTLEMGRMYDMACVACANPTYTISLDSEALVEGTSQCRRK